jgi:hypothetical protein
MDEWHPFSSRFYDKVDNDRRRTRHYLFEQDQLEGVIPNVDS